MIGFAMGNRANFAIRERGKITLYYSEFGALEVPAMMFFGPAAAERELRALPREDRWLEECFAEGGAVVDHDTSTLVLFGGAIEDPKIQAFLVELMRNSWPGWTVRWAEDTQRDLVTQLGLPESMVETSRAPIMPLDVDRLDDPYPQNFAMRTGLFVVCMAGHEDRYIGGLDALPLLAHGAEGIGAALERLPTADVAYVRAREMYLAADAPLAPLVTSAIAIGPDYVRMLGPASFARRLRQLADRWPRFALESCRWGSELETFFRRIDREVPAVLLPRPETPLDYKLGIIGQRVLYPPTRKYKKKREAAFIEVVRAVLGEVGVARWEPLSQRLRDFHA